MSAEAKVARLNIVKKGQNIGYIEGAGDAIPESLTQIGYTVTTIAPSAINTTDLSNYDAIVVGIRAYNTVPELAFTQMALNKYVENGGTLMLQYNTCRRLVTEDLAPYPLKLSRDRVTDELSQLKILAANHKILTSLNTITQTNLTT